jgi:hypothetical protein
VGERPWSISTTTSPAVASLAVALPQRFGITEAGLTRRWQQRLADMAG